MSVGTAIRDAIFAKLETRPGYGIIRKWPRPILQPEQLPSLTVSLLREERHGGENEGEISFRVEATIGISMVRGFKQSADLEVEMHAEADAIEDLLLRDPEFTKLTPTSLFEAVTDITRDRTFHPDGQTYLCEMQIEMKFRSSVAYEPIFVDDYHGATIKVRPIGHDADTPSVTIHIDPPNS